MDYLMTYGWAILVTMIVGIVLWMVIEGDDQPRDEPTVHTTINHNLEKVEVKEDGVVCYLYRPWSQMSCVKTIDEVKVKDWRD